MTANASEIILHNYPQSPVAEKVRVVFDSQCIIREIERRYPSEIQTANAGLMWCLSRFTDGDLFSLAVKIVLGAAGDDLPEDFARDRGQLYFGNDWADRLKQANAELPHLVSQLRAPLSWINENLRDGRKFILGSEPAAIDAQLYYVVWFIRGRWNGGPSLLAEFSELERWEHKIKTIGHGNPKALDAAEALAIAQNSKPTSVSYVADNDPQGLTKGMPITVGPDMESGEQLVEGIVHSADAETVAIELTTEEAGTVCVHFPRTGYRIEV